MHNFVKSNISIADSLDEVGFKLKYPKKGFFAVNKERLKVLFMGYSQKAASNSLHTLTPEWPLQSSYDETQKNEIINKRMYAYGLYGSERIFVNKHWERLTAQNGGEKLYCPICGLHECEEMDHYVPRDHDKYPEYSAHLDNLIPLCHNCNHKKSNKFLGNDGERLYFNAYFDTLTITQRNILVGVITLSPVDGLPQIEVNVNPILSRTNAPDKYIISTIDDLGLMNRFNDKAKYWLKYEMVRISHRFGQSWKVIKNEMIELAMPLPGDPDIVHPAVLGAIANSTYMEEWFNNETNKL